MSPELEKHLSCIIHSPCRIVRDIQVKFRSIIDSSLSSGNHISDTNLFQLFFCFLDFFEVTGVLFSIDIVGIFVISE